ncbi:MAG: RNase adapter RapZ, partial [Acidimicrobiales bacterium]
DLGWLRVDNMPPAMFAEVARLVADSTADRVAFVAGTGAFTDELAPGFERLRAEGHRVRVLFLDASDEVLVRRFEGTRHRHPLAGTLIEGSIHRERELLEPIRAQADIVLDTSDLNENDLRRRIAQLFSGGSDEAAMHTALISFGYKHGLPLDADLVLDCRFLPNPHWIPELQALTGLDARVRDYVLDRDEAREFITRVDELLGFLLPKFLQEGKSYMAIAVGCTGGRHRSVAVVEELAERLRTEGHVLSVFHRDVHR